MLRLLITMLWTLWKPKHGTDVLHYRAEHSTEKEQLLHTGLGKSANSYVNNPVNFYGYYVCEYSMMVINEY